MIEYVTGDLLESDEPIIAHGCNTMAVMGSGIARLIHLKYGTKIYEPYEWDCATGQFVAGAAQRVDVGPRIVYNLATQRNVGRSARAWWVTLSMANMFEKMQAHGDPARVAIPRIGCGVGGLRWKDVEYAIRLAQVNSDINPEVVVYTLADEANKEW